MNPKNKNKKEKGENKDDFKKEVKWKWETKRRATWENRSRNTANAFPSESILMTNGEQPLSDTASFDDDYTYTVHCLFFIFFFDSPGCYGNDNITLLTSHGRGLFASCEWGEIGYIYYWLMGIISWSSDAIIGSVYESKLGALQGFTALFPRHCHNTYSSNFSQVHLSLHSHSSFLAPKRCAINVKLIHTTVYLGCLLRRSSHRVMAAFTKKFLWVAPAQIWGYLLFVEAVLKYSRRRMTRKNSLTSLPNRSA